MAEFLVESYTPAAAAIADIEARVRAAAEKLAREGMPVRYVRSIFVPEDETCFHLFEADSASTVRAASERAGLRSARLVETAS